MAVERWLLVVVMAALLAGSIDWGLPSAERVEALLGERPVTERQREMLTTLRARHYAGGIVERSAGAELGEIERIEALRAFLLGSSAVDERKPYSALSRMDPGRLDLDPKIYLYGGSFLYPIGALVLTADRVGWLDVHRRLDRYLEHPEDAARLYLLGRALSAGAYLGVLVLLAPVGDRLGGRLVGTFAMVAWSTSTLALNQAVVTKPHVYAAFWALLAVALLLRAEGLRARDLALAGAAAGLSVGASLAAAIPVALLPLMIGRCGSTAAWSRRATLLWATAFGGFLLSNPYLPFALTRFASEIHSHGSAESWGYGQIVAAKLPAYLGEVIVRGYPMTVSVLALVAAGCSLLRGSPPRRRLGAFLLLQLLVVGVSLANLRISLFVGPLLCLFAGIGAAGIWRVAARRSRALAVLLLLVPLVPGTLSTLLFARDTLATPSEAAEADRWLDGLRLADDTGFGIYPPLHPVKTPPFPFLNARVVRLDRTVSVESAPEWVVVGNHEEARDLRQWQRHPLRGHYELVRVIGSRPFGGWAERWRVPNQAYKVAWIYRKRPASSALW